MAVFIPSREMNWVPLGSSFCLHSVFILSSFYQRGTLIILGFLLDVIHLVQISERWDDTWWKPNNYFVGVNFTRKSSLFKLRWQLTIIDNLILCKTCAKLLGEPLHFTRISAFQLYLCRRQRGCTTHDLAPRARTGSAGSATICGLGMDWGWKLLRSDMCWPAISCHSEA